MKQFTAYFGSNFCVTVSLLCDSQLEGSPRPIHPRTWSLPAADLLRPGAKNLRQRRQGRAMTFTICVDKGSSNLTAIKDEVTHIILS